MPPTWIKLLCVLALASLLLFTFFSPYTTPGFHTRGAFDLFRATGLPGLLMVAVFLFGLSQIPRCLMQIRSARIADPALLRKVETLLGEGGAEAAAQAAQAAGGYAGKVIAGGLCNAPDGYAAVREGLRATAAKEAGRLNAPLHRLSWAGNAGPLLGMLGSLTGISASLRIIEMMRTPTPGDLSFGVFEACVNTALGTFIALAFLPACFFLKRDLAGALAKADHDIGEIVARALSPRVPKRP